MRSVARGLRACLRDAVASGLAFVSRWGISWTMWPVVTYSCSANFGTRRRSPRRRHARPTVPPLAVYCLAISYALDRLTRSTRAASSTVNTIGIAVHSSIGSLTARTSCQYVPLEIGSCDGLRRRSTGSSDRNSGSARVSMEIQRSTCRWRSTVRDENLVAGSVVLGPPWCRQPVTEIDARGLPGTATCCLEHALQAR